MGNHSTIVTKPLSNVTQDAASDSYARLMGFQVSQLNNVRRNFYKQDELSSRHSYVLETKETADASFLGITQKRKDVTTFRRRAVYTFQCCNFAV